MARKKTAIQKESIEDLLAAANIAINQIIPQSYDTGSKDIHFSVDITYKSDRDWTQYIPKNKNTKKMRELIENAIISTNPHAIMLHIYATSSLEHCKYSVKLQDTHIPVMDDDTNENKPVATIQENVVSEPGLGAFGTLHVQRMQDKIEAIEKEHERELDSLKEKLDNERRFSEMTLKNKISELERESKEMKEKNEDLKKQIENSFEIMDELEAEVEKNGGSFDGLKNVALMGIASKVLGLDAEELSGLMGINNKKELPEAPKEKAGELIDDDEPAMETHPRADEIDVISTYLKNCSETIFRTVITIIQALNNDPDKAEIIKELLIEKSESDGIHS